MKTNEPTHHKRLSLALVVFATLAVVNVGCVTLGLQNPNLGAALGLGVIVLNLRILWR